MGSSSVSGPVNVGDVPVHEVWKRLSEDSSAVLVDVRTRAEWSYVGLPDLTSIGKRPVLAEWSTYPQGAIDPAFADKLAEALETVGATPETEIFFICRSGGRSLSAARALAGKGFKRCHNVADGFEGPLDPARHRGRIGGWKAAGLPWIQS